MSWESLRHRAARLKRRVAEIVAGRSPEMSYREFIDAAIGDFNALREWLERTGMTPAQAVEVYDAKAIPLRVCRPERHPDDGRPVLRMLLPPRVLASLNATTLTDNYGRVGGGAGPGFIDWTE